MPERCSSTVPQVDGIPLTSLVLLRTLNFIIASLNISGNAFLIYALRKTAQTKKVSMKFILFMSISDLLLGFAGLALVSLNMWSILQNACLLRRVTQGIIGVLTGFSVMMIPLIALDRYLHMTYLQRYQLVMTVKRGYIMMTVCFFISLVYTVMYIQIIPSLKEYAIAVQSIGLSLALLNLTTIAGLYYKAYKNLLAQVSSSSNQIFRPALAESRRFNRIAKMIAITVSLLSIPVMITSACETANLQFMAKPIAYTFSWLSFLLYTANAFSSSMIFLTQNTLIKNWIRRYMQGNRISEN